MTTVGKFLLLALFLTGCSGSPVVLEVQQQDPAADAGEDPPSDGGARGITDPVRDASDVADADAGGTLAECEAAQCAWGGGSCGDIQSKDPACPGTIHCVPCGGGGPDF